MNYWMFEGFFYVLSLIQRIPELFQDLRNTCIDRAKEEIVKIYEGIFGGRMKNLKILYCGPAAHTNLGDSLLGVGSLELFHHYNAQVTICGDIQTRHVKPRVPACDKSFISKWSQKNRDGIAYYHPGGNWGDLYGQVQKYRLNIFKILTELKIPIISGPQTLSYAKVINDKSDTSVLNSFDYSAGATFMFRLLK